jgi:hypothetical protein
MLALFTGGVSGHAATCNVFLLKETGSQLAIEKVILEDGEVTVFSVSATSEHITVLLPFGIGQSGDIIQRSRAEGVGIVKCSDGEIHHSYRRSDGSEKPMPVVSMADMMEYDMRVNIIGASGIREAFWIRAGQSIAKADGPVIDMFRGAIPLQEGDYSITIEVTRHEVRVPVEGKANVVFDGEHLFVEGRIQGGESGLFIVDFGAGATVVQRDALPTDSPVERLTGLEYSDGVYREIHGIAGGLGGAVESFLGKAPIGELGFGTAVFPDVSVSVVASIPDIGGKKPIGILGIDLLGRADVVSVAYDQDPEDLSSATLEWLAEGFPLPSDAFDLPFSVASNHIFIPGSIGDVDVDFVFDTGARVSIIPTDLADAAGLVSDGRDDIQLRGLDGNVVATQHRLAPQMMLGSAKMENVTFYAGEIAVLDNWGLGNHSAIIGNSFLGHFSRIQVDFLRGVIHLIK